jgi:DNA (cytosine-5)-methyltransferase 1
VTTGEAKRQDWETCTLISHTLRGEGFDASEDGTGRGTPESSVHAFDARQRNVIQYGDKAGPLDTDGHSQAIAFSAKDHGADAGDTAPTLRAMGYAGSHANGGGQVAVAVAFAQNQRDAVRMMLTAGALAAQSGAKQQTYLAQPMAVRRLTPRECERLQGFPDDYTLIPYRNKHADQCPDGPRYKALGNSMAVPVMRWIGERIAMVEQITVEVA